MYSALKSMQPQLLDNYNVEINFQNNALLEEFHLRLKPLLQTELRKALNNEYIEIIEKITETEKLDRPKLLSEKEKLEQMIEKNPAILHLKNKFKLDFE
jgi:DNA polymerase III subunit gamma/tau